jgi:hypothetical protein
MSEPMSYWSMVVSRLLGKWERPAHDRPDHTAPDAAVVDLGDAPVDLIVLEVRVVGERYVVWDRASTMALTAPPPSTDTSPPMAVFWITAAEGSWAVTEPWLVAKGGVKGFSLPK